MSDTKMPLVSVIIPTWNRKDFLKRAIDSVLMQDGISVEILVCDDGSTDGTVEMVSSLQDPRVRLITGPRAGRPAIPRNRGIREASGEWLAFLDDDDEWLPGKMQAQFAFAKEKGYLAATTNALRKIPGQEPYLPYLNGYVPECCDFKTLVSINFVITSSVIIHSSLLKRCEGFPESKKLIAHEDYALWLRIGSISPFGYITEPYILYTDMPTQSVRRLGGNDRIVQLMVYCNWFFWAKLGIFSRNGLILIGRLIQLCFPAIIYNTIVTIFEKGKSVFSKS